MDHSSKETETGTVTLHQTADYNNNNDMEDTEGEDWLDLSILDAKPKLDLSNMNSDIIFYHNNGSPIGSMTTNVYMNTNMAGGTNQNGNTVANGFAAAKKLSSVHNDVDNNNSSNPTETNKSKEGEAAATPSNGIWADQQGLPLPASTDIVGAMKE